MRWRILAGVGILFCIFFFNIGSFLARMDMIQQADLIVILSGSVQRVDRAVELAKKGFAPKIAVTTDAAYHLVLKEGLQADVVVKPAVFAKSTFEEGLFIKKLLRKEALQRVIIVSDGYHLFRARWTVWLLCRNAGVHFIYAAPKSNPAEQQWWRTGNGRMFVFNELAKIGYYFIWHGLLAQDEDPLWISALERRYNLFLQLVVG